MTRCTEPERWAAVPGAEAAEEEVASYLAHAAVCPFHAAVEQREEALVRGIVTLAGRDVSADGAEAYVRPAESGDRLDAEAESRSGPSGRGLPVAASGGRRARASARRAPRPSDETPPAPRRPHALGLTVALCALAAVVLLAFALYRPGEERVSVVKQEQPPRPAAADATPPTPTPEATPPAAETQNRGDAMPATPPRGHAPTPAATPRVSQGAGRISQPQRAREQLTVAEVRRIYVGAGEGAHDSQLREALIERLRAGGRFIVVAGERQADAVLLREQSRSAGVTVQLVTRGGETLWFTTQPNGARGVEDVGELAARIVDALTAAADQRRTPADAPRR